MRAEVDHRLDTFLPRHWGVITRQQAETLGVRPGELQWALRTGRWIAIHRGVYARASALPGPEGRILGACLALGPDAVASHRSAGYLWGLLPRPPSGVSATVSSARHPRPRGVEVHRSHALGRPQVRHHQGIPLTAPDRTVLDLAVILRPGELDEVVDRARQARLLTVPGLAKEARQRAGAGRRGPRAVLDALDRRGMLEPPSPSILESRTARLLRAWQVPVISVETAVMGGRYRLDFLLRATVALEVDGFAYHSSPESKAADASRRAALAARGITVIEADWITVTRQPEELRRRILAVLAAAGGEAAAG